VKRLTNHVVLITGASSGIGAVTDLTIADFWRQFELAEAGISVTLVTPGNIATNIRRTDNRGVLHPRLRDPIPAWLQMRPERAARQIVDAFIRRRFECILTRLARVAIATERMAPTLVAEAIKLGRLRGRRVPRKRQS
jgi:short-subunit dehydrogenase